MNEKRTPHIDIGFRKLCLSVYKLAIKDFVNPRIEARLLSRQSVKTKKSTERLNCFKYQKEACELLSNFEDSVFGLYLGITREQVANDINTYKNSLTKDEETNEKIVC